MQNEILKKVVNPLQTNMQPSIVKITPITENTAKKVTRNVLTEKHLLLYPPQFWSSVNNDTPHTFTIATFNTLRRHFGDHGKDWVSDTSRSWNHRKPLLHHILQSFNADFICIQEGELNTFKEDYGDFMHTLGYNYVQARAKNQREKREHGHTKPTIFYRQSRMKLLWQQRRSRTILASFRLYDIYEKEKHCIVYIINCHLRGGESEWEERFYQIRSALTKLRIQMQKDKNSSKDTACILCGDFNSLPGEAVYELVVKGYLDDENRRKYIWKNKKKCKSMFRHNIPFRDVWNIGNTKIPFTHQWHTNENAIFSRIDFIFYNSSTMATKAIRIPFTSEQKKKMISCGLPCEWHPSDHLPVVAQFQIFSSLDNKLSI